MQRGARFFFRRSAPMQRGAHFATFDVPGGAPCWAQRARQKRYEINYCVDDFPYEEHTGSGHQMYLEDQHKQNTYRKPTFYAIALGALWCPLG